MRLNKINTIEDANKFLKEVFMPKFNRQFNEVKRIAPPEANAYTVGDFEIEWKDGNPTHHVAPVTFYKIEVDTTQRLDRTGDIQHDFGLVMSLTG